MVDSIIPSTSGPWATVRSASGGDATPATRVAGMALRAALSRLGHGTLVLTDKSGTKRFGHGAPVITVDVHNRRAYLAALRGGSTGLGTSYAQGWWDSDDLTGFLRLIERNLTGFQNASDRVARQLAPVRAMLRRPIAPNKEADRQDIQAHYDLGNEFYELMLDETMAYSCAVFNEPSVTLREASTEKLDRLCRRLNLSAHDHVVEIGTGWGSFAIYAAKKYGCRVTTTTISDAQYEYTAKRVAEEGLGELVTVLNQDYRDLEGVYDKLISIEMIEAVGWRELDTYFATCARLLRPDGVMALQAIVINDRSFERAKTHNELIKNLIFPGGFLPSIESIARALTKSSDFRLVYLDDIGRHYAETLRRWGQNLKSHSTEVDALGMGSSFTRLWQIYLSYCEAAFLERHISNVQVLLARQGWRDELGAGSNLSCAGFATSS